MINPIKLLWACFNYYFSYITYKPGLNYKPDPKGNTSLGFLTEHIPTLLTSYPPLLHLSLVVLCLITGTSAQYLTDPGVHFERKVYSFNENDELSIVVSSNAKVSRGLFEIVPLQQDGMYNMCTHMHTCTHAHMHAHTHAHTHACMHTHPYSTKCSCLFFSVASHGSRV